MRLRPALLALPLALGIAAALPAAGPGSEPEAEIAAARGLMAEAEAALERAESPEARLAALGRAVTAQEKALAALRRVLGALAAEEADIRRRIAVEEPRLPRTLGALQALAEAPRSALLAYPDEPAQAARAAALLEAVLPALEARMERLRERLSRLAWIRDRRAEAAAEVADILPALQEARRRSEQALAARRPAMAQAAQAIAATAAEAAGAADLDALARTLVAAPVEGPPLGFADSARGKLPLPVVGDRVSGFSDPRPPGRGRDGWTLAAPAYAQVVAPWDGTVRFADRLAGYGNVMVLEPESGYLILITDLASLDRRAGEVVLAGEKLGDMGGALPGDEEFLRDAATDADLTGRERLFLEVRVKGDPVDPAGWFGPGDM